MTRSRGTARASLLAVPYSQFINFFINARGLGVRRKFVRGSKAHAILARTPAREANQGGVKHGNFFFKIGITSFYGLSDGSKLSQSSTDKRGETR